MGLPKSILIYQMVRCVYHRGDKNMRHATIKIALCKRAFICRLINQVIPNHVRTPNPKRILFAIPPNPFSVNSLFVVVFFVLFWGGRLMGVGDGRGNDFPSRCSPHVSHSGPTQKWSTCGKARIRTHAVLHYQSTTCLKLIKKKHEFSRTYTKLRKTHNDFVQKYES